VSMKKLFLASSFQDVAKIFEDFESNLLGKRVTFIPTASLVEKVVFYVEAGKKALEKMGLLVDVLEVSMAHEKEIKSKIESNDFIYITGGNTFFLLQELQRTGADKIIAKEVNAGKLYIGESAGAMVVSKNIEYAKKMDSVKKAPDLKGFDALDLVEFYPVPHFGTAPFKKVTQSMVDAYSGTLNLLPINNQQAISVCGSEVKILQN